MTPEEIVKLQMRLQAIEFMVANLYAYTFKKTGVGLATAKEAGEKLVEEIRTNGMPAKDPAVSDHLSAELEDAMQRILDTTQILLAEHLEKSSKIR